MEAVKKFLTKYWWAIAIILVVAYYSWWKPMKAEEAAQPGGATHNALKKAFDALVKSGGTEYEAVKKKALDEKIGEFRAFVLIALSKAKAANDVGAQNELNRVAKYV